MKLGLRKWIEAAFGIMAISLCGQTLLVQTATAGETSTFVEHIDIFGKQTEFTIPATTAGNTNLTVTYALAGGDSAVEVDINSGQSLITTTFASTGGWSSWGNVSINVVLAAGANTVRFTPLATVGGPKFNTLAWSASGGSSVSSIASSSMISSSLSSVVSSSSSSSSALSSLSSVASSSAQSSSVQSSSASSILSTSVTIEAENYDSASLVAPFVMQSDSGRNVMVWPGAGGNNATASDTTSGQLFYPLVATAASMTFYATVNFANSDDDSFHFKLAGVDTAWTTQNTVATSGYQELQIATWNNLTLGQTYILKIQRREDGAKLDSYRLQGGAFAIAGGSGSSTSAIASSSAISSSSTVSSVSSSLPSSSSISSAASSSSVATGSLMVEAENYASASPVLPFVMQNDNGRNVMVWPGTDGIVQTATDTGSGQLYYPVVATGTSMTIYVTANFPTATEDSFYYKLEGKDSAWGLQNNVITSGYQELQVAAWTNVTVGQTYTFKVQRREDGTRLDNFRITGGKFMGTGSSSSVSSSIPASSSSSSAVSSSSSSSSSASSSSLAATIEAENYNASSPVLPFETQTDGARTVMVWPGTDGIVQTPTDAGTGQLHYSIKASAASMTLYITANFPTATEDSFYYRLVGKDANWGTQNNVTTAGYAEVQVVTWSSLTVGQTYNLHIQRREDGTKLDKLRIVGGGFVTGL